MIPMLANTMPFSSCLAPFSGATQGKDRRLDFLVLGLQSLVAAIKAIVSRASANRTPLLYPQTSASQLPNSGMKYNGSSSLSSRSKRKL